MPLLFSDSTSSKSKAKDLLILGHHSKPQTAVTDWIDRICDPHKSLSEIDLDGFLIELVDCINLQPTGPEEASRAIRKQLKHGRIAQQKKSLIVLEALVLNGGHRFRTSFADGRLVECIKATVLDPRTDQGVRRRTMVLLSDWERAYRADPEMALVAGLYKSCGGRDRLDKLASQPSDSTSTSVMRTMITGIEQSYITQEPGQAKAKAQAKQEKKRKKKFRASTSIDLKYRTDLVLPDHSGRPAFDLVQERPQILQAVATASQCANNLVNCLQLVDHAKTDIETDAKVQVLLEKLKVSQKVLVRYIRAVTEKDTEGEYTGTLLNTNNQVISALQLYDLLRQPSVPGLPARDVFSDPDTPLTSPDHCQSPVADLLGLDFDRDDGCLPEPIAPEPAGQSAVSAVGYDPGTLEVYSDFESEDEEPRMAGHHVPVVAQNNNPFFKLIGNHLESSSEEALGNDPSDQVDTNDPFADPGVQQS